VYKRQFALFIKNKFAQLLFFYQNAMGLIHKLAYNSSFLAACGQAAMISSKPTEAGEMFYSLAYKPYANSNATIRPAAK
jgi:hypothetical protein